jgi:hypothetical protein
MLFFAVSPTLAHASSDLRDLLEEAIEPVEVMEAIDSRRLLFVFGGS